MFSIFSLIENYKTYKTLKLLTYQNNKQNKKEFTNTIYKSNKLNIDPKILKKIFRYCVNNFKIEYIELFTLDLTTLGKSIQKTINNTGISCCRYYDHKSTIEKSQKFYTTLKILIRILKINKINTKEIDLTKCFKTFISCYVNSREMFYNKEIFINILIILKAKFHINKACSSLIMKYISLPLKKRIKYTQELNENLGIEL